MYILTSVNILEVQMFSQYAEWTFYTQSVLIEEKLNNL